MMHIRCQVWWHMHLEVEITGLLSAQSKQIGKFQRQRETLSQNIRYRGQYLILTFKSPCVHSTDAHTSICHTHQTYLHTSMHTCSRYLKDFFIILDHKPRTFPAVFVVVCLV